MDDRRRPRPRAQAPGAVDDAPVAKPGVPWSSALAYPDLERPTWIERLDGRPAEETPGDRPCPRPSDSTPARGLAPGSPARRPQFAGRLLRIATRASKYLLT